MFINLYQIVPGLDNGKFIFQDLKTILRENNNTIPSNLYECVFSGEIDAEDPEEVYAIFNLTYPKDYHGRSMSVSDVVEFVNTSESSEFYFCDRIGFEIIEFDKLSVRVNGER